MTESPIRSFDKYLDSIKDPRHHNIHHRLHDILFIALCAIISGAESWTHVAEYGRSKFEWFKEFLELPNGIPSHDTFGRLFARLDPKGFQDFFSRWVQDLVTALNGKTVAIDGKTIRSSHDRANAKSAIHMVSAWVSELSMENTDVLKTDNISHPEISIGFRENTNGKALKALPWLFVNAM